MNDQYAEYLGGEEWKRKRSQRLEIAKRRCAACGSSQRLHVHHLTYARIFNEDMADLLPLCEYHHVAAEELVKRGALPRGDNVLFLATETIRLVLTYGKKLERKTSKQPRRTHAVPDGPTVTPTKKLLRSAMTVKGGINTRQLQLLGVPWPPRKKWLRRLIGTVIPKESWEKILLHRDNMNNVARFGH